MARKTHLFDGQALLSGPLTGGPLLTPNPRALAKTAGRTNLPSTTRGATQKSRTIPLFCDDALPETRPSRKMPNEPTVEQAASKSIYGRSLATIGESYLASLRAFLESDGDLSGCPFD